MISLLCPTRGRPWQIRHMLWSATQNCTERFQAVFFVDLDDQATAIELQQWREHPRVSIQLVRDTRYAVPMSDMWNHCAQVALEAQPVWPLLFIDDEASFISSGWDRLLVNELMRQPDGALVVHPDDTIHGSATAGYFATTPAWVEIFGRLTPSVFTYGYADVWVMEVAQAVGRLVYVPEIVIENLAPKLQPPDWIHQQNHARAVRDRPGDLYNALQPQREQEVLKLGRWIEDHQYSSSHWAGGR